MSAIEAWMQSWFPGRYIVTSTWSNADWRVWDTQMRRIVALKVSRPVAERIASRLNSGRPGAALLGSAA